MQYSSNIQSILDVYATDLTTKRICTSAINGYGVFLIWVVSLSIKDKKCRRCLKWATLTPILEQVIPSDRACHQWKEDWHVIGECSESSLEKALESLDKQVSNFKPSQ